MKKLGPREITAYVYFVGETDGFRYETSADFVASVKLEHPDIARECVDLSHQEIGQLIGEAIDNDALELRLKTQPEDRVYARMILLAETFLKGSKGFQVLRDSGHNSILYTVFRRAEDGNYLIRACGTFPGEGLLSHEEALKQLCRFLSDPLLRSRFESDELSPSSSYRLIVQQLENP